MARELEHYKEESVRLDSENERLQKESSRLLSEHRSHEDDIQYLESQMVTPEKENHKPYFCFLFQVTLFVVLFLCGHQVTLKKENHKLKRELEDTATKSMHDFLSVGMESFVQHIVLEDTSAATHPHGLFCH